MRVISQNGKIDLPYEQIVGAISNTDGTRIVAFPVNAPDDTYWRFAKYSTEEKAEKVMEMLRTEYERHFFGNGGAMAMADFYVQPFAFIPPKVFRFPQDSVV